MKFKEYVQEINQLLADHPESADYDIYSSIDPEGNGYYRVNYGPEIRMRVGNESYYVDHLYTEMESQDESLKFKANIVLIGP